ncbi:hypothetical protein CIG75_04725 [Tumebacillus algifaecis]|uniref:Aminoglycoside phosphotransferase domain-containing protein n=1 Tax=Tumebacillus algifaecis TaxID=1214604 RepID=A0A223CYU5_9BACL|nr:phosphotransferase [Tumebacillus algifaecis]ASS74354.1 hypothetical protein CIG75_04725 [Tumebacillus algifaecis]
MDGWQALIRDKGWQVLASDKLSGGFTGSLYRLHLRDEAGQDVRAVFKRFAPDRKAELAFYERVVPHLPSGVPKLYGIVPDEGILIEDAGTALKPIFIKSDLGRQRGLLERVVTVLADMHATLAVKSQLWLVEGIVTPYPFDSSIAFAQEALAELHRQIEQLAGVNEALLAELRMIESFFYPRYPDYVSDKQTFTHGDPHMENILLDAGRIRLIDWEYASLAVPERDLAILLQDVLDVRLHSFALTVFRQELAKRGWVITDDFERSFTACLLDNTLMMLGFELWKYRHGHLSKAEIETILPLKIAWIRNAYTRLKKED